MFKGDTILGIVHFGVGSFLSSDLIFSPLSYKI